MPTENIAGGLLGGLVFSGIGFGMIALGWRERRTYRRTLAEGIRRPAEIVGFTPRIDHEDRPQPIVRWVRENGDVSRLASHHGARRGAAVGDHVTVCYLAENPANFIIVENGAGTRLLDVVLPLLGSIFAALGIAVLIATLRQGLF